MMKVLNILNSFLPDNVGGAIRPYNLLSRIPYEIQCIVPNKTLDGSLLESYNEYRNIKVNRVNLDQNYLFNFVPFRFYKEIFMNKRIFLKKALKENFEIVHGHNICQFGHYALEISKTAKKPFIFEIHYAERLSDSGIIPSVYEKYLSKKLKIFEKSECIVVLTEALKKDICNYYNLDEETIKVVPNGVDINKFKKRKPEDESISKLKNSLNLSNKVVMYSGFLDKLNGISDFIEILPKIIKERPNISFVFIGSGPLKNKIIFLSKKYPQIKYISIVKHEYMPLYYQLCDIFVIPRPHTPSGETIVPLKLLEAMSMERTVLGSNVGGISELINNGKNGYLFEKGNKEELYASLVKILNSNKNLGKKARNTVERKYTWEKSALKLKKIYENAV